MTVLRLGLFAVLLLALVGGCGNGSLTPVKLTGKVTYNGQPVKAGSLTFHTDMGSYGTSLAGDGSYEIVDLPAGEVKVTVDTEFLNPGKKSPDYAAATKQAGTPAAKMASKSVAKALPPATGGGKAAKIDAERKAGDQAAGFGPPPAEELAARYMKIPAKYAKPATTTLTLTLEAGRHVKDLELTD